MVNYSISKEAYNANIYAYIAGFRIQLNPSLPQGSRVSQIEIKQSDGKYQPLELDKTYRLVTNSFLAQGGDGNSVLKNPNKQDTNK